jgi:hypothetical protein
MCPLPFGTRKLCLQLGHLKNRNPESPGKLRLSQRFTFVSPLMNARFSRLRAVRLRDSARTVNAASNTNWNEPNAAAMTNLIAGMNCIPMLIMLTTIIAVSNAMFNASNPLRPCKKRRSLLMFVPLSM